MINIYINNMGKCALRRETVDGKELKRNAFLNLHAQSLKLEAFK